MEVYTMTISTRDEVFAILPFLMKEVEKLMREAIRAAHIANLISPDEFIGGMLRLGGTGTSERVTLRSGITMEVGEDPYAKLDLQTCLKYLLCGGLRIVSRDGDNWKYAMDQDIFYHFFGIEYRYETVPERPCKRMLNAGNFSASMLQLYRIITADAGASYSLISNKALPDKVKALIGVIQPLGDTLWEQREQSRALMRVLSQAHFAALDTNAEDLYAAGCRLQQGEGLPRDPESAVRCYQAAAAKGSQAAQLALAKCQQQGDGTQWDIPAAVATYRALAEANYSPALLALAECYLRGTGVNQCIEQAEYLYLRAAELGNADALNILAEAYQNGNQFPKDQAKAFRFYTRSAEAGSVDGAYHLGECFRTGMGTARDDEQAVFWFRKAAEGGNALGMFALASCCMDGMGTQENLPQAITWYRNAADTGSAMARAMADAATVLLSTQERASEAALHAAVSWVMLLAQSGEASAAYLLAHFYTEGIGVQTDAELAFSWYHSAAQSGSKPAVRALADCYFKGFGVEADPVRALVLYSKAVEERDCVAAKELAALLSQEPAISSLIAVLRQRYAGSDEAAEPLVFLKR